MTVQALITWDTLTRQVHPIDLSSTREVFHFFASHSFLFFLFLLKGLLHYRFREDSRPGVRDHRHLCLSVGIQVFGQTASAVLDSVQSHHGSDFKTGNFLKEKRRIQNKTCLLTQLKGPVTRTWERYVNVIFSLEYFGFGLSSNNFLRIIDSEGQCSDNGNNPHKGAYIYTGLQVKCPTDCTAVGSPDSIDNGNLLTKVESADDKT